MIRTFSDDEEIGVEVHFPIENPEFEGEYLCKFRTFGLSKNIDGAAIGVDEIQAIANAFMRLDIFLRSTVEYISGELKWDGASYEGDFGLPWQRSSQLTD